VAHPDTIADDPSKGVDSESSPSDPPLSEEGAAAAAAAIDRLREGQPEAAGRPPVHTLLDQAEAALGAAPDAANVRDPGVPQPTWSSRRRLAFFVGVNGFCWALILLPVLL
jgi:hypothetical protein